MVADGEVVGVAVDELEREHDERFIIRSQQNVILNCGEAGVKERMVVGGCDEVDGNARDVRSTDSPSRCIGGFCFRRVPRTDCVPPQNDKTKIRTTRLKSE
jgi:hypothetical protein